MKFLFVFVFSMASFNVQAQIVDLYKSPRNQKVSAPEGTLRHVVLFKFKAGTPLKNIEAIEKAFAELPNKIPQIKDFEWGTNNSPENLDKGFTHCFFLTFEREQDRAIYLPHPDHKAFGTLLSPWMEDVLVLDYWAESKSP